MCYVVAHMRSLNKLKHMAIVSVEVLLRLISPKSLGNVISESKDILELHGCSYLRSAPGGARFVTPASTLYVGWNGLAPPEASGSVSW